MALDDSWQGASGRRAAPRSARDSGLRCERGGCESGVGGWLAGCRTMAARCVGIIGCRRPASSTYDAGKAVAWGRERLRPAAVRPRGGLRGWAGDRLVRRWKMGHG